MFARFKSLDTAHDTDDGSHSLAANSRSLYYVTALRDFCLAKSLKGSHISHRDTTSML